MLLRRKIFALVDHKARAHLILASARAEVIYPVLYSELPIERRATQMTARRRAAAGGKGDTSCSTLRATQRGCRGAVEGYLGKSHSSLKWVCRRLKSANVRASRDCLAGARRATVL